MGKDLEQFTNKNIQTAKKHKKNAQHHQSLEDYKIKPLHNMHLLEWLK